MFRIRLLIILSLFTGGLFAQTEPEAPVNTALPENDAPPPPKQYYWLSPRVSVTVPHPLKNAAFHKCFVGVYEINVGMNLMLYKGFFVGGYYKNNLQRITENKIADYNASLNINTASIKLGNDLFIGDKNRVIFSAAVSAGQCWADYSGLKTKTPGKYIPTKFNSIYVEPEVDLYFLVESNFGIGASVTYTMLNHSFDPYELSLNEYTQFGANNSGTTQYLCFGFGFYYSLLHKHPSLRHPY